MFGLRSELQPFEQFLGLLEQYRDSLGLALGPDIDLTLYLLFELDVLLLLLGQMRLLKSFLAVDAPEFKDLERLLKLPKGARPVEVEELSLAEVDLWFLVQGVQDEVGALESLLKVVHAHVS